ncbi:MAG: hypothetical protein ACMXYG_03570 [Candidatus Woesearchaeota archaeon]
MEIQYVDLDNIPIKLRNNVDELLRNFMKKINSTEVKIHVKRFSREGRKSRFEIHLQAVIDAQLFVAQSEEWDCYIAVKDTLTSIKTQHEKFKLVHAATAA